MPSADVVEYKVEKLAKNLTVCNARRLAHWKDTQHMKQNGLWKDYIVE